MTAQSAFLNNFEDIVNRRVNIDKDIKHYQDTLSYASSKVDYSMGENICMLPRDMNLKIRSRTVGYNNKILVSDGKFSLGKNNKVNFLALGFIGPASGEPVLSKGVMLKLKSHKDSKVVAQPTHAHELEKKPTHEEEKLP